MQGNKDCGLLCGGCKGLDYVVWTEEVLIGVNMFARYPEIRLKPVKMDPVLEFKSAK